VTPPRQIYVQPGEVHCSTEPCVFKTVLGSCISVCLFDEKLGIGGLNHYVLPKARGGETDARFGDIAIPQLIEMLRRLGCNHLIAKIFGGANVMPAGGGQTIGESNAEIAKTMLALHKIPLIAQRTGGMHGVALRYLSATGEVLLRQIPNIAASKSHFLRAKATRQNSFPGAAG
jgi:chemotaxis protein CheD